MYTHVAQFTLHDQSLLRVSGKFTGLDSVWRLVDGNGRLSLGCYVTEQAAQAALAQENQRNG